MFGPDFYNKSDYGITRFGLPKTFLAYNSMVANLGTGTKLSFIPVNFLINLACLFMIYFLMLYLSKFTSYYLRKT